MFKTDGEEINSHLQHSKEYSQVIYFEIKRRKSEASFSLVRFPISCHGHRHVPLCFVILLQTTVSWTSVFFLESEMEKK